jgi:uncharacterized membrane protein (DUF373 family)
MEVALNEKEKLDHTGALPELNIGFHRLDFSPAYLRRAIGFFLIRYTAMGKLDPLLKSMFRETKEQWPSLNLYERFEQAIAMILSLVISVIIVIALIELMAKVWKMLINGALDPLDHEVFQAVFGAIMTLLIAMEFKHSIVRVVSRKESIIQIKTVIFIAILALSRKFIILDTSKTDAETIAALAITILALAGVYWLVRDSDRRNRLAHGDLDGG